MAEEGGRILLELFLISTIRQNPACRRKTMTARAREAVCMIKAQESGRTALVIGCGIGGPVAAMALQQAGIEPKIFEARAESADFAGLFLIWRRTAWMRSMPSTRRTASSVRAFRRRGW
jgi:hypothetical protein